VGANIGIVVVLAIVAAAVLSDRYISDRFLPDKAIDLIDESAARLRMEITSDPQELDMLKRRMMQLEIEREALKKESDKGSVERLKKIDKELTDLKADVKEKTLKWLQDDYVKFILIFDSLRRFFKYFRSQLVVIIEHRFLPGAKCSA
jgi:ATP-dependent Clp protease ATP-binding subunit ClpA